jgi:hypothetical protein
VDNVDVKDKAKELIFWSTLAFVVGFIVQFIFLSTMCALMAWGGYIPFSWKFIAICAAMGGTLQVILRVSNLVKEWKA